LRIVHDIHFGHRQIAAPGEVLDQGVEVRLGRAVDLTRAVHAQNHLVGVPVSKQVHASSKYEGNEHTLLAAEQIAHRQKQAHQCRHKQTGARSIHRLNSSLPIRLWPSHMMARQRDGKMMDNSKLTDAARRALTEAEERRKLTSEKPPLPKEVNGRAGPEPTRFGDWESKGIASDF